jgi:hypothetical protein
MGVQTKQILRQALVRQNIPVRLPWFFLADGVNDPSIFADTVESVTRFISANNVPQYRVRLSENWALSSPTTIWLSVSVRASEETIYYARYVTPGTIPSPLADPLREFDVAITFLITAPAPAISQINTIVEAQVSGEILVDQAP